MRAPRTLILDETFQRFRDGTYFLPPGVREIEGGEYFRHLLAPVCTIELDNWSQPVATYKHRQPDDFAHAEVYATLATMRATLGEGSVFYVGWGPQGMYTTTPEHSDYA